MEDMVEPSGESTGSAETNDLMLAIAARWRSGVAVALLAGALGVGVSYLIKPTFEAETIFLPPQQQGGTSAALASLGALASLAGGSGPKNSADQYVALMQSTTVRDRMIEQFKLMDVYGVHFHDAARRTLAQRSQIGVGKKDGLITVSVQDTDPTRAAAMANQYVEELRRLTSVLAVSEAQQRRVFFEKQLQDVKAKLTAAQSALQDSGFTLGALKSEPRAAADGYAKLHAEETASEIRLQTLRSSFADSAPEVQTELTRLQALRSQLHDQELSTPPADAQPDYVSKYREFKYQETLFDLMARQFELAKVDESREGALIQVVDPAREPEHKVHPRRIMFLAGGAIAGTAAYLLLIFGRLRYQAVLRNPEDARRWSRLRSALAGR
jgi:uncharacterized protein involved in exopolysaccharide biosynthesis